jgi:hypothetical protein
MRRLIALCCAGLVMLSVLLLPYPTGRFVHVAGITKAQAETDPAELMKQRHHKQRTQASDETKAEESQNASVVPPETVTGNYDYLVLIVLVASVVVLALVTSRKGRRRASFRRS